MVIEGMCIKLAFWAGNLVKWVVFACQAKALVLSLAPPGKKVQSPEMNLKLKCIRQHPHTQEKTIFTLFEITIQLRYLYFLCMTPCDH